MTREDLRPSLAATVQSDYFGKIDRDTSSEIHLPLGLPGFESETCLVAVEIPEQRPLVYLQSASNAALCFLALPASAVVQNFRLELTEDERSALFLNADEELIAGENVLALAILFPASKTVQANLSALLVINLRKMVAIQCIPSGDTTQRRVQLSDPGNWVPVC